ncbi:recombinase family protein [Anaerobacillus sp. HL2]|nr:recombinase family protein [Anaerobacillus sp. HL2]
MEASHKRKALAWVDRCHGEYGAKPSVALSIGKYETTVIPLTLQNCWHVEKEEAKVIRRIFREVRKGATVYQIAVDLSERKILTPQGNETWSPTTIKNILKSVVYKGDILFQQTVMVQNGQKEKYT